MNAVRERKTAYADAIVSLRNDLMKWRERFGINIADAARMVGVARSTLNAFEKLQQETYPLELTDAIYELVEALKQEWEEHEKGVRISALLRRKENYANFHNALAEF